MSFMFFEAFPTSVRALKVDNSVFFEILGIFFFFEIQFFFFFVIFVIFMILWCIQSLSFIKQMFRR